MKDKVKGSLTVEAAMVLPLFFLVMYTLIMVMKLIYVHDMVQHALTETAEDLAAYGYLYQQSGILDVQKTLDEEIANSMDIKEEAINISHEINNLIHSSTDIEDEVVSLDPAMPKGLIQQIIKLKKDILAFGDEIKNTYMSISNFIEQLTFGTVFTNLAGEGYEYLKTVIGGYVSKKTFDSYLTDQQLRALNIKGGVDGLDFSRSKYFYTDDTGEDLILLAVEYEVSIPSFIDVLSKVKLINTVKTRGWTGMAAENDTSSSDHSKDNEETSKSEEQASNKDTEEDQSDLGDEDDPSDEPAEEEEDEIVYLRYDLNENRYLTSYYHVDCWRVKYPYIKVHINDVKDQYERCNTSKEDNQYVFITTSKNGSKKYHNQTCSHNVYYRMDPISLKEVKELYPSITECRDLGRGNN